MNVHLINSGASYFGQTGAGAHMALHEETVAISCDGVSNVAEFMAQARPVISVDGIDTPIAHTLEGFWSMVRLLEKGRVVRPARGDQRIAMGDMQLRGASVEYDAANLAYQRAVLRG